MLVFGLTLLMCLPGVHLTDDFSQTPGPAADRWRVIAGQWRVEGGKLRIGRSDEGWLALRGLVPPVKFEASVEVTPTAGSRPGVWGAVGLACYLDRGNYWRLALVENATDKKLHYCELVEKLDGVW
ncbi:MAG: hypothetical protein J7M26_10090, partial [Armatimonadetes bacterium]|nr:hypothetical protein [Armatimonadota bacterium]